jgi:hypothetical protein
MFLFMICLPTTLHETNSVLVHVSSVDACTNVCFSVLLFTNLMTSTFSPWM